MSDIAAMWTNITDGLQHHLTATSPSWFSIADKIKHEGFLKCMKGLLLEGDMCKLCALYEQRPKGFLFSPTTVFQPENQFVFSFVMTKCPPASFKFMIDSGWCEATQIDTWLSVYAGNIDGDNERLRYVFENHMQPEMRLSAIKAVERWATEYTRKSCTMTDILVEYMGHCAFSIPDLDRHGMGHKIWIEDWCPRCKDKTLQPSHCIRFEYDIQVAIDVFSKYYDGKYDDWNKLLCHILTSKFLTRARVITLITNARSQTAQRIVEEHSTKIPRVTVEDLLKVYKKEDGNDNMGWALCFASPLHRIMYKTLLNSLGCERADKFSIENPKLVDTTDASTSNLLRSPLLLLQADVDKMNKHTIYALFKKIRNRGNLEELSYHMTTKFPEAITGNDLLSYYVWRYKEKTEMWMMREYLHRSVVTPLLMGMSDPKSPVSLLDQHTVSTIVNQIYSVIF